MNQQLILKEDIQASAQEASSEQHVLHRDFETRSPLDLRAVGAHRYAADPDTQVLCVSYAIDDGLVQLWTLWASGPGGELVPSGEPIPAVFFEAAVDTNWKVSAHNDGFESAIEQRILAPRYGFPLVPMERHRCSQVMALALGLPAKLENLADALELANRKDAAGERLMHQMAKPRKPNKKETAADNILYFDDADRLRRLGEYCKQDTEVEREAYNVLRALVPDEHELWQLTATINGRGFHIDRNFAEAARKIAKAATPEIDAELLKITGGVVTSINQVARLHKWLREQGCKFGKSLDKKVIEKLLAAELSPLVRQALELRLGGAKAAVAKYVSFLTQADTDDRVRGGFRHHGGATGRWSAEKSQPQNLKRITYVKDINAALAAVGTGDYEVVRAQYEKPLTVVGECIRPTICAAPGYKLIGGDLSSIENRFLAWVAKEEWKLESFRKYDLTHDSRDEPYCVTACKIYRVPDGTITKESHPEERGTGKICELAFGFSGALGAWRKFDPDKFTDEEVEQFKKDWRAAHPRTVQFWRDITDAALMAVRERGRVVQCGCTYFKCVGSFLFMKLPSGRKIAYPYPRIKIDNKGRQVVVFTDNAAGRFVDCRHGLGAYAATWTENLVQGGARDLLAEAMVRIEAAGYPIILTIHDELVCEVPEGFGSEEEFRRLLTQVPNWLPDLPVAADVWTGQRYCK